MSAKKLDLEHILAELTGALDKGEAEHAGADAVKATKSILDTYTGKKIKEADVDEEFNKLSELYFTALNKDMP